MVRNIVTLALVVAVCACGSSGVSTISTNIQMEPASTTTTSTIPSTTSTALDQTSTSGAKTNTTEGASPGSVGIESINYDGPDNDVVYNDSEYLTLINSGASEVDVGGWSITDEADHVIRIPAGYSIPPGGTLRIYTGPGDPSDSAYFAGESQAIWNNSGGDTATLFDSIGNVVDTNSYSS